MLKRRSARSIALTAAVVAGGLAADAQASLTMDVRVVGGTATIVNPKNVSGNIGDTISLAIFGQVSGTNGIHDEDLGHASGSITTAGAAKLNAQPGSGVVPPWNGASSTNGSLLDIDSDGDVDLGSAGSTSTGKLFTRTNGLERPTIVVDSNTTEMQMAQATFTITGGSPGDTALLNYVMRTNSTGGPLNAAAGWFEDNASIPSGHNPVNGLFTAGPPVQVTVVPEPAALGLLALGSLGLLKRRR